VESVLTRQQARKEFAEAAVIECNPCYSIVALPVLVSGDGTEKLLGVPKLAASTGDQQAEAVHRLLKQWKLVDKVQAMSFDTTSGNTGRLNGHALCWRRRSVVNFCGWLAIIM